MASDEESEIKQLEARGGVLVREKKWFPSLQHYYDSTSRYPPEAKILKVTIEALQESGVGRGIAMSNQKSEGDTQQIIPISTNEAMNLLDEIGYDDRARKSVKSPRSVEKSNKIRPAASAEEQEDEDSPPPAVDCIFCGSRTRFEHYNNHQKNQPRYRCLQCKQRFTFGGRLQAKRMKLLSKTGDETGGMAEEEDEQRRHESASPPPSSPSLHSSSCT